MLSTFEGGLVLTSNDGGVTGVILGDVLLDLADKVSADVSSLGVDTATNTARHTCGLSGQIRPSESISDNAPENMSGTGQGSHHLTRQLNFS